MDSLPFDLLEQILNELPLRDVLKLRPVCRWVAFVASFVANRFISFPTTAHSSPESSIALRENEIRLYATTLLSEPVVRVRRFTLSGEYNTLSKADQNTVHRRMTHITKLLLNATNLQHLRVRTVWGVALPILQTLEMWPKLHRLDVPVRAKSWYLAASQLRYLTLRLAPHEHALHTIPPLLWLTHLKIDCNWPYIWRDEPANTRLNFSRYPRLKWLKLCGKTPPQFLDTFEGQTTSLKRCIIGDHYDLRSENHLQFDEGRADIFFSRFAENLEAMIIHSGWFKGPISTVFPKLHSLKVTATTFTPAIFLTNCPQLAQLSIISRETVSQNTINKWLIKFLPFYDLTLQNLQLIRNPIFTSGRASFDELSNETIGALAFCESLKFLEISGLVFIPERGSRVLGRGHPELEAVMLNCTGMCDKQWENLLKFHPIPGLEHVKLPEGRCLAGGPSPALVDISTIMQVSKRLAWNDFNCPCGRTQRRQFARRMDPQNMFIDEDDDYDHDYEDFDFEFIMLEDDRFPHRIEDGLPANKKRAEEEEVGPEKKRQKTKC